MATNGKLPASSLTKLSTPGVLLTPAAASYERLKVAAKVTGTTFANHAYRSLAEQEKLFSQNYQRAYCEYAPGKVDKRIWNGTAWYRKPGKPSTAVPGTSNHGWGLAVDWQGLGGYGGATFKRFAALAPQHGWNNKEGANIDEAWHWVYVESADKHKGDTMELNDRFKLSAWMKAQFPDGKEDMSVGYAYGYAAAGAYTTANNSTKILKALDTLVAGQKTTLANEAKALANQTKLLAKMDELISAVKNIEVTVPPITIPSVEVTFPDMLFTGEVIPKD